MSALFFSLYAASFLIALVVIAYLDRHTGSYPMAAIILALFWPLSLIGFFYNETRVFFIRRENRLFEEKNPPTERRAYNPFEQRKP